MSICGILNIDKPTGMTSRDAVNHVVRCVRKEKVGHSGTLDPLATGVLVVCVGHATRLIEQIQSGRKRYRATFELGCHSETDDITGNVVTGGDWRQVTDDRLKSALSEFIGRIQQVPPQFSAVHVDGQRAYKLARQGQSIQLTARPVDVFSIELITSQLPRIEVEIECGSGTYIRSIARDLGLKLGCGAVMSELRRTAVGPFEAIHSIPLDQITSATIGDVLQPALAAVSALPRCQLTSEQVAAIRCGKTVPATTNLGEDDVPAAMIDPGGQLIGIAAYTRVDASLQPRIVFPLEVLK